jgi:hypothetical protein
MRARVIALASTLILALTAAPFAANAHFLAGSWPYTTNALLTVTYENQAGASPTYARAIDQAAANWTNTSTPLVVSSVPAGAGAAITVGTVRNTAASWWGYTYVYAPKWTCSLSSLFACRYVSAWIPRVDPSVPDNPCLDPCALPIDYLPTYSFVNIQLNHATADQLIDVTGSLKLKLATHEFGHALGLGHRPWNATYSIMRSDATIGGGAWPPCAYTTPQAHDIIDINRLYVNSVWPSPPMPLLSQATPGC